MYTKTGSYLIVLIIVIVIALGTLYVLNTRLIENEINKSPSASTVSSENEEYEDARAQAFEDTLENGSGEVGGSVPVVNELERKARDNYELELEVLDG